MFLPMVAVTAVAAFALGWAAKPSDSSSAAKSGDSARQQGSKSSLGSRLGTRSGSPIASKASSRVDEFITQHSGSGEMSAEDISSAIAAMRKENDPILRRKLFTALLEQLTPDNAKGAYLAMQSGRRGGGPGRGGGGDDELRLLANAWGRIDGPGAVQALTEMRAEREAAGQEQNGGGRGGRGGRGGDMRGGMDLVSVLSGWATVDGAGAANYVSGIEDDRQKQMAGFGVVQGMMVNGVDEAMGFISSLPRGEDGGRAQSFYTSMVASEMLEQGLDSAKAWVDGISDPALRGGALSRVAESAIRDDLAGAVEWVSQYAGDESASRAVSRVASQWANDDPQAVLTWADSLPDTAKAQAYGEAFDEWTRKDATAAGEYLTTMQASPARDAAVEQFSTSVAREEPQTAIQWAETIADQEARTEALTRVAQTWYRQDKEATTEWLATSGLPEESVKAVTTAPQRGGGRGGR